jgi:hypothetical protein
VLGRLILARAGTGDGMSTFRTATKMTASFVAVSAILLTGLMVVLVATGSL